MWDFMSFVGNEFSSAYWADAWAQECKSMEDQGFVLIDHRFDGWDWDHNADIPTFDRLLVRTIPNGTIFTYEISEIQQANADYVSRKWFSTIGQMA